MAKPNWDKLEPLHSKWLEENCRCENEKYCNCMDLLKWYAEEVEQFLEDNQQEEMA